MMTLNQLEEMLAQGKITRREFLVHTSALGIVATISPSLFTTPAHASVPKKGGHFRLGIGHGATTDSLDPALNEHVFLHLIYFAIHNHIAETLAGGKLIPELAEVWEASPNATTWIFKVRKGVEFHNGNIELISEEEKGSLFRISFPIHSNSIEMNEAEILAEVN